MKISGVEFVWQAMDWLAKGLSLDASAAFTRAKVVANARDPLSVGMWWLRVQRTRGHVLLAYRPNDRWMGSVGFRHEGRAWIDTYNLDINPDVFGGVSRLNQLDMHASYKPTKQIEIAVGLSNATKARAYPLRRCR